MMTVRTTRTTVIFRRPFQLRGRDETFPPGSYDLETDEEGTEVGDRTVHRRIKTSLIVRSLGQVRDVEVQPADLAFALKADSMPD